MRRIVVLGTALVMALSVCAASAAPLTRPRDEQLAAQIAPTAGDLGARYRRESAAEVHAPHLSCPARTTGCARRFFALPDDPHGIASAIALVEISATPAQARSAYRTAMQSLSRKRNAGAGGVQQTISLRSEAHLSPRGAQATLLVIRLAQTAPARMTETSRSILLLEGRAQLLISYKAGRTVGFAATARRLAARMQPARS
jgi:hypothetical protein